MVFTSSKKKSSAQEPGGRGAARSANDQRPDITGGYMFKFDDPDPDEQTFLAGGIDRAPDGGAVEIYQYPKGQEMVSPLRTSRIIIC